jgi:hypothetical protein
MYRAFAARELGFGYILSNVQLQRINGNRLDTEYLSKYEAILLRGSAEKQPITRVQFDIDLVNLPFLSKSFRYGRNHEGYWTNQYLTNLIAFCPDFAVEKSDLEHLADELGCLA